LILTRFRDILSENYETVSTPEIEDTKKDEKKEDKKDEKKEEPEIAKKKELQKQLLQLLQTVGNNTYDLYTFKSFIFIMQEKFKNRKKGKKRKNAKKKERKKKKNTPPILLRTLSAFCFLWFFRLLDKRKQRLNYKRIRRLSCCALFFSVFFFLSF
jgi:hypothetical protein